MFRQIGSSLGRAMFNNLMTLLLIGGAIIFVIYYYATENMDKWLQILISNTDYIVAFIMFIMYLVANHEYIRNYAVQFLYIIGVFFVTGMLAYIETDIYLFNMLIIVIGIVFSLMIIKFISVKFKDLLGIDTKFVYMYYYFYLIGVSMINDYIILYSLVSGFTVFLILAYTTYIPANLKININKLYNDKKYKGITEFFYKKSNKINNNIVSLIVLVYFLLNFVLFFKEISATTLVMLSICFILLVALLAQYNTIDKLKYNTKDSIGFNSFNGVKTKFSSIIEKIRNKGK